ncbi:20582_t:CDS:2 [Rhizophagus irregularis]|nr:20582_t:CDS:2 [Rhizophagus irregularis]
MTLSRSRRRTQEKENSSTDSICRWIRRLRYDDELSVSLME